jgi:hypothetical protein
VLEVLESFVEMKNRADRNENGKRGLVKKKSIHESRNSQNFAMPIVS